jgi:hypothetical protein
VGKGGNVTLADTMYDDGTGTRGEGQPMGRRNPPPPRIWGVRTVAGPAGAGQGLAGPEVSGAVESREPLWPIQPDERSSGWSSARWESWTSGPGAAHSSDGDVFGALGL